MAKLTNCQRDLQLYCSPCSIYRVSTELAIYAVTLPLNIMSLGFIAGIGHTCGSLVSFGGVIIIASFNHCVLEIFLAVRNIW